VGNMSITPVKPIASFNPAHPQKPIILLVEDESMVRQVTREVLEHAGYQVLESGGPQEALHTLPTSIEGASACCCPMW